MSLLGSIQIANTALQANDAALQVVGQNIANANTPGYIVETANFVPGPPQTDGGLIEGTGVQVQSITQQIDTYLETQLRNANSDQQSADNVQQTYSQLENIVCALSSSTNLSSALNSFFSAVSNVLNSPQDQSVRQSAVLQGQSLVSTINSMEGQTEQLRSSVDNQISAIAPQINTLTNQIAGLNIQIAEMTGGGQSASAAVGLTDQRNQALSSLSQLLGIQANTQPDGSISVSIGGNILVNEGTATQVSVASSSNRGMTISAIQMAGTNSPIVATSGQLAGLTTARDQVLGGFEDQLNSFAATLANEFNKVYSGGQGLTGYSQTTAVNAVSSADAPLNNAGLSFTPTNGSFSIIVTNSKTGTSTTTNVPVNLLGTGTATTLNSLAASINNISGLQAQVTGGKLTISSTGANTTFAFGADTSGTLAALGINTFFTGSNADNLAVNPALVQDPTKFAASSGGVGVDTNNAQTLANFLTQPLASKNGATVQDLYNNMTSSVTDGSANATAAANAADSVQSTLSNRETAVSGVNLDTQVVDMLQYQESYQASARYISTLSNLLQMLTQI